MSEELIGKCPQKQQPSPPAQPSGETQKCGKFAASFIPRRGEFFSCVLAVGHEGECRPGGTCFTHGPYVGEPNKVPQCPRWPECAGYSRAKAQAEPSPRVERQSAADFWKDWRKKQGNIRVLDTPWLPYWAIAFAEAYAAHNSVYVSAPESEEVAKLRAQLADTEKDRDNWKREFEMYRDAWKRELGGWLIPKAHLIDALVLTTRKRCVNPILGNCSAPHWLGKPTEDRMALQQTPHPMGNNCKDWKPEAVSPEAKPPLPRQITELLSAMVKHGILCTPDQVNVYNCATCQLLHGELLWLWAALACV